MCTKFIYLFIYYQKCIDREDKVYRGNNQVINLTTNYIWSGCKEVDMVDTKYFVCDGKNIFMKDVLWLLFST